jgi:hypothetical protein
MFGVQIFCCPYAPTSPMPRSSARMKMMFGFCCDGALTARSGAGMISNKAASAAVDMVYFMEVFGCARG